MLLRLSTQDDSENSLSGIVNSQIGISLASGLLLRPELPQTTADVIGIDLTHRIDVDDIAFARGGNGGGGGPGGGGGGPGGGGGGGGGGSGSFDPYTSGSGDPSAIFNITIEFTGEWTQAYYDIFVAAADELTSLITDDVEDVKVISGGGKPTIIDDIVIQAELTAIDGPGGILGQAGPTSVRTIGKLPATAVMQFDTADADAFNALGLFGDIVLHEMSHSLGFGSIWSLLNLVSNDLFTGTNASAEYVAMGGAAGGVPVEADGGSGTAGSHWDEATFIEELMTGYIDDTNYFTAVSAASFADLGYGISATYGTIIDPGYTLPVFV